MKILINCCMFCLFDYRPLICIWVFGFCMFLFKLQSALSLRKHSIDSLDENEVRRRGKEKTTTRKNKQKKGKEAVRKRGKEKTKKTETRRGKKKAKQ